MKNRGPWESPPPPLNAYLLSKLSLPFDGMKQSYHTDAGHKRELSPRAAYNTLSTPNNSTEALCFYLLLITRIQIVFIFGNFFHTAVTTVCRVARHL